MTNRKDNDFLNGVPELLALQLLARKPMHGYELVQTMKQATDGVLSFGEGCVYPVLHRLEAEGVLSAEREAVNGRERVVYRLTAIGNRRLEESAARWKRIADAVVTALQGESDGQPALA